MREVDHNWFHYAHHVSHLVGIVPRLNVLRLLVEIRLQRLLAIEAGEWVDVLEESLQKGDLEGS